MFKPALSLGKLLHLRVLCIVKRGYHCYLRVKLIMLRVQGRPQYLPVIKPCAVVFGTAEPCVFSGSVIARGSWGGADSPGEQLGWM